MSWKAFALSATGIVALVSALLLYVTSGRTSARHFVAYQGEDVYKVQADEARVEGFCTVFVRDNLRIAAVCGQHTWSEAVETE